MRKLVVPFLFFFVLTISAKSNSDKNQNHRYSGKRIELFIVRGVFRDNVDELVFKSSDRRLEMAADFLQHRRNIAYSPRYRDEKIRSVSDLPLSHKYIPNLESDLKIFHTISNPLTYDFPSLLKDKPLYRLEETDCLLMIFLNC